MSLFDELKKIGAIGNGKPNGKAEPVRMAPALVNIQETQSPPPLPVIVTEMPLPGLTTQELKQTILDIIGPFLRASRKRLARISDLQQKSQQLQELLGNEILTLTKELDEYEQVYKELETVIGGAS